MTQNTHQGSEHISQQNKEMAQVLVKIVADKEIWVAERKKSQPLDSFQSQLTASDRDFYAALTSDKTAFILECKKASPSKGLIRDDFDLDYIASTYNRHANAISVLTDEKYFQGNFDFLPQVRAIASQPILCKDFMIDPYQVYLARYYQADAILLMLSVLNDDQYTELADIAHSLGLGVLTEVSNDEELERALALKAKVVGINNRNLRDLSTDLNRTKELAPKIPSGTIIISESGIYTHQQVRDLSEFAHGFLIGSSLMAEDDLELAARKVILGENKVCGLTHADDAAKAYQAGAIFGGLIFVEASKRHVDLEAARFVMSGAPLRYVGVFQNHSIDDIISTCKSLHLAAIQLHGQEDQLFVNALKQALNNQQLEQVEVWKAYGVSAIVPALLTENIDRHLLDSQVGQQTGGTGVAFDWSLLDAQLSQNIMLAGGLNPDNAQQAAKLGCLGLDFNSGVETAPGTKDSNKLALAFAAVRQF
ncbi:bifunctional indole-3-glycerol phosphate synthase/phosphoribosylanthranilate isomerase [Vibrio sp. 10N.286.49.B3]|uniref:bifunctional indole-3-glycerol-phosphate synthase TrpC/phosphoribosylanthranilate isomerase TrpF n=1 Tax=Vibrio sp. 10N.286.49.B3 TaxID=1880855 RepID=UPI000C84FBFC|nr:bifunctional indole-3-glycerol-phosphate synthase TrpC/phosphoribosylanthranilate isomerase TrpF [Vibrio sp. 10N.286.49.B3]PMH46619.1 bifunctional indole-3-glycerol phosphate synthase/phosphoribosylanthranilate isomerase [Vibrio sp. 10N.286.49.B3]